MALLSRIKHAFSGGNDPRNAVRPLYLAIVHAGRDPDYFRDGAVPDTIQGRFEMICAMLCLVLLRLESDAVREGHDVLLTELFVADMDGQLRESGVGDVVVGKKIGNMMGALGGRLGVLREAFAAIDTGTEPVAALSPALVRNLYDNAAPADAALRFTAQRLNDNRQFLAKQSLDALLAGQIAGGQNG